MTGFVRQCVVFETGATPITSNTISFPLDTLAHSTILVLNTSGGNGSGVIINITSVTDTNTNTYKAYDAIYSLTYDQSVASFGIANARILTAASDHITINWRSGSNFIGFVLLEIAGVTDTSIIANNCAIITGGTTFPTTPDYISGGLLNNPVNQNIFVVGLGFGLGFGAPFTPANPIIGSNYIQTANGWDLGAGVGPLMTTESAHISALAGNNSPTFTAGQHATTSGSVFTLAFMLEESNAIKLYSNGALQSAGFIENGAGPAMKHYSNNYVQLGGLVEVQGQVPYKLYGANGTFVTTEFVEQ